MGLIFKSDWIKEGHENEMNIMLERDEIQSDGKENVVIKTHF